MKQTWEVREQAAKGTAQEHAAQREKAYQLLRKLLGPQ